MHFYFFPPLIYEPAHLHWHALFYINSFHCFWHFQELLRTLVWSCFPMRRSSSLPIVTCSWLETRSLSVPTRKLLFSYTSSIRRMSLRFTSSEGKVRRMKSVQTDDIHMMKQSWLCTDTQMIQQRSRLSISDIHSCIGSFDLRHRFLSHRIIFCILHSHVCEPRTVWKIDLIHDLWPYANALIYDINIVVVR